MARLFTLRNVSEAPGNAAPLSVGATAAAERIRTLDVGTVSFREPLKEHCSWRIGGPADIFVQPSEDAHVLRLLRFVREEGLPLVVIGRGTNLLFADEGFRGVVMKLGRRFSDFSVDGSTIRARGGLWVPRLVKNLVEAGLSGLEHAAGIPGSFGGLVTMNGGSLRRSVGERVVEVRAVSFAGETRIFSREECGFSYRSSLFQHAADSPENRWIVLEARLELVPAERNDIRREVLGILEERRGKFPLDKPNCGSVFTNDPTVYELAGPPGKIVEATGLKGLRVGGAEVSHRHANFIVNLGGATASDVLVLVAEIRRRVHDRIGVWLECEVRYVGADGTLVPASTASERPRPGGK